MKKLFVLVASLSFLFSCSEDMVTYQDQLEKDIKIIEKYLADSNLVAQSTKSGLHYIIEQEGNGNFPPAYSYVKVKYTGKFLNGEVFDDNTDTDGTTFGLASGIINGWKEGIPLFSVGGKGKLFIPSGLGYGSSGFFGIPANSVLIFDIELVTYFPPD